MNTNLNIDCHDLTPLIRCTSFLPYLHVIIVNADSIIYCIIVRRKLERPSEFLDKAHRRRRVSG